MWVRPGGYKTRTVKNGRSSWQAGFVGRIRACVRATGVHCAGQGGGSAVHPESEFDALTVRQVTSVEVV